MQFREKIFHQIFGIAMGTPLAPVLANLYLAILEKKLKSQIENNMHTVAWPLFFKRYIDDILIISNQSRKEVEAFLALLNKMVPSLKFKLESGGASANFLDLKIFKGRRFHTEGLLDIEIYQKPLNAYAYIPYSSYHPKHTLKGFVQSELKRYVKGNSCAQGFYKIAVLFEMRLLNRGYPKLILQNWFSEVTFESRNSLI